MKGIIGILTIFFAVSLVIPLQSCQNVVKVKKKAEEITSDMFEYSLNSLGDKLFALIPNGDTKANLREKYDDFVIRAVNGDVEPEQIEYVAANILNATNSQETIQPELAKVIVFGTDPTFDLNPAAEKEPKAEKTHMSLDQTKSLGENLSRILKMNDELKISFNKISPDENFGKKIFYKYDNGIVMTIDEKIKSALDEAEFEDLFVELIELEKIQKMEWQKELSKTLKIEHQAFRKEMKKIKELETIFKDWEGVKEMEFFAFDDSNYYAPFVPEVLLDSIMQNLSKSLEQVGNLQKINIHN